MCLPSDLLRGRNQILYRILRVLLEHLTSSANLCGLEVCHTSVPRSPIAGSSRSAAAEPCSDSDLGSAVCLGRTVSLRRHHSYLTAKGVADSTGHPVSESADCGLVSQHTPAARRVRTTLHLPGSPVLIQTASVGIVWTTIAANDRPVLLARDALTRMGAHTVYCQLGGELVSWSLLE
jgi:hypothetical protein